MLSILPALTLRLQQIPSLVTWDVRNNIDPADRTRLPAIDLRCGRARVADRKTGAVRLAPEWTVTLMLRIENGTAEKLDAALAEVIKDLHNWAPGICSGKLWDRLSLLEVSEPDFADAGMAGYTLTFSTAATYMGQQ